jgi:hypothetical protein
MPTISVFFGIVIRMYFDDHNPPRLHAEYRDDKAVFILEGIFWRAILVRELL